MEQRGWDEHELVRRCKEGSESAYAELIRQHRPRLLNLVFRLVNSRETAEDVVQEAFIAAFRTMERFEPRPALAPWLNTIAVRLAGRAAQKRAGVAATSLDQLIDAGLDPRSAGGNGTGGPTGSVFGNLAAAGDPSTDPQLAAEATELRRELGDAIAALPFKYRTAVVLRFVAGLDYAEAARTMDVPLNTYKSHLLRGTRALREALEPGLARAADELDAGEPTPGGGQLGPALGTDGDAPGPGDGSETAVGRATGPAAAGPQDRPLAANAGHWRQPARGLMETTARQIDTTDAP